MPAEQPWIGPRPGVANAWVETVVIEQAQRGDHAIRTGAFRGGAEQGVRALLRVP
jgi:hypothetical protein